MVKTKKHKSQGRERERERERKYGLEVVWNFAYLVVNKE
jgi:hypothetical protein